MSVGFVTKKTTISFLFLFLSVHSHSLLGFSLFVSRRTDTLRI